MTTALEVDVAVRRDALAIAAAFRVDAGRPVALVGPNGAGKSSVVGAIAGLVEATGSVRADERELLDLPPERRRVGVVFQDLLLFRHLTVLDNVAFAGRLRVGRRRAREAAGGVLDRLGLVDLADRLPQELSGGQAQRVALARSLAAEPDVLLLDEPMAALDVELRDELRGELGSRLRELAIPVLVVTHSARDVAALADDVVVLERGAVTQRGSVAEVRRDPATAYVRRLLGSSPG